MKKYIKKILSRKVKVVKENKSSKKKESFSIFSTSYVSFSTKQQTFFAKRLSFLIKAGVPMLESMHVIKDQTKSKVETKVFDKVISDIQNGQSLAVSLGRFKKVFGNFAINVIKAGEHSGTLIQNLNYLADELKKKAMLKKKIMGALLYPIIVTVATFGITGFLTVYIFPKIIPVFTGLHAKLPISTRMMIWLTDTLKQNGFFIFLIFVILVTGIILLIKFVPKVRFFYDGLLLRLPVVGNIVKNYNLTNSARTLGLLLRSGISLNEALIITSDTTENKQYSKAYADISLHILKGKTMSSLIILFPTIFPSMLGHMISIGEKSGNLSNTLIYLSEYYENEFEDQTKNLSSTIEPVLMIIMGLLVGFVAISVITPIYEITNTLQR
ncbi:MAG: hypothetical protein QG583_176 [Patescibacteria group bacterium]|nr:hypothetical protein [Patescibacteria group bacterium]